MQIKTFRKKKIEWRTVGIDVVGRKFYLLINDKYNKNALKRLAVALIFRNKRNRAVKVKSCGVLDDSQIFKISAVLTIL